MSYPLTEFGLDNLQFFVALLRACPEGSRLSFDRSEPEAFVQAFREWSHRDQADTFEADYYRIDARLIAAVEQTIDRGELQLDHHFGIVAPDGRPLCSSMDDFAVVALAEDVKQRILLA
jgi:hypothetical protein